MLEVETMSNDKIALNTPKCATSTSSSLLLSSTDATPTPGERWSMTRASATRTRSIKSNDQFRRESSHSALKGRTPVEVFRGEAMGLPERLREAHRAPMQDCRQQTIQLRR